MTPEKYSNLLLNQFEMLNVPKEEVVHRRNAFNQALAVSATGCISTRYYNLAHELKCLQFLTKYGTVNPALDYLHAAGCDAVLSDHYQIEFVCTSPGANTDKSGYDRFSIRNMRGFMVCDYSEKEKFLFSRITSVLDAKRNFYKAHIAKNALSSDKPYLIFLGLGELSLDMFCGDYGIALTGVLLGKGHPVLKISNAGKLIDSGYTHNESFAKYTGAPIDCNLFCRDDFRCVSGIIFSDASLYDAYTTDNTWLFLNPFANVKIRKKDFPGMVYWCADKDDYFPRRRGKRI